MFIEKKANYRRVNYALVMSFKLLIVFLLALRLSLLPNDIFKDRINYLFSVVNSEIIFFDLLEKGWFSLLHEPLYKLTTYVLNLFFESETILILYVFVNCLCVFSFIAFNRIKLSYSILALLTLIITPYIFASTLGAIQQGLGLNLILISLIRKDDIHSNKFAFALFLASLFHVIFYVFLGIVFFYRIVKIYIRGEVVPFFFTSLFIVLIGFLWSVVTPYLNESQSYADFQKTTSGITFIGWASIFILFFYNFINMKKKKIVFNKSIYILAIYCFLCFLVFYWLAPGPYRVLYSAIPLVVYSLFSNLNKLSAICIVLLVLYSLILHSVDAGAGSLNISFIDFVYRVLLLR